MKTIAHNQLPNETNLFPVYTGDTFWLAPHNGQIIVGIPVRGIFGVAELQNGKLVAVGITEFSGQRYFANAIAAANESPAALQWAESPRLSVIA